MCRQEFLATLDGEAVEMRFDSRESWMTLATNAAAWSGLIFASGSAAIRESATPLGSHSALEGEPANATNWLSSASIGFSSVPLRVMM
jgi:hypothetical protein